MVKEKSLRQYVYWPNFGLSQDGKRINVWSDAGLDVQVTLHNSLVQCVGQPMSEKCRWFRMKVDELTAGSFIMFGVNVGCLNGIPGWDRIKSSRYISDTGGIFSKGKGDNSFHKYGPGDEVVCYIEQFFPDRCLINFFKNGKLIDRSWAFLERDDIYATVGVKTGPAQLTVDWPIPSAPEYKFDINSLDNWITVPLVVADNGTKTFSLQTTDRGRKVYNAQAPRPLDKKNSYFELEILGGGLDGMGIGLTSSKFVRYSACGWGDESVCQSYGYHSDDGGIRRNMNNASIVLKKEWECRLGDKMGCGIILEDKKIATRGKDEQVVYVYVTKNGKIIHVLGDTLPIGGYYPTVFFMNSGDKIRVKQPCPAPLIDIETENMCRVQKDLISEFKYSYRVRFPNFENDNGAKVVVPDDPDEESRYVKCIRDVFKPNDYFQVTSDNYREVYIGLTPYDVITDDPEMCYFLPKMSHIKCKEGLIQTRTIDPGKAITVFLKDLVKNTAVFYFFEGEVFDKKVLGRASCHIEDKLGLYPTVLFKHKSAVKADIVWREKDLVDFEITHLSSWIFPSHHFMVDGSTITLNKEADRCPFIVQSSAPLSKKGNNYFEVTLVQTFSGTFPGVGVCSVSQKTDGVLASDFDNKEAAAFYLQKGIIQCGDETISIAKRAPKVGDKVGCHIMFPDNVDQRTHALAKFYLNDDEIGKVLITLQPTGMYLALCFESPGDAVSVNFECEAPLVLELKRELSNFIYATGTKEKQVQREKTAVVQRQSFGHTYGTKVTMPKINGRPIYVYISHTNGDSQKANTIFSQLSKRGYLLETTAWNATTSAKKEKIEECDAIVFCISEQSVSNKEQGLELQNAQKKLPHRVFAVMVGPTQYPPGGQWKSFNQFMVNLQLGGRKFSFLEDQMDFERFQKKLYAAANDEDFVEQGENIIPVPIYIPKMTENAGKIHVQQPIETKASNKEKTKQTAVTNEKVKSKSKFCTLL